MFLSRGADIDVRQVKSTHTYANPTCVKHWNTLAHHQCTQNM